MLVHGQADFQPGYIITVAGDTLPGWVDARVLGAAADRCSFRATPDSPLQQFLPDSLRGYGFDDGRTFRVMPAPKDSVFAGFVEVLAEGAGIALYRHQEVFYLARAGRPIKALTNTVKAKEVSTQVNRENREYRGVLLVYLADCPGLRSKIEQTALTERALLRLLAAYANCRELPLRQYGPDLPYLRFRPGVVVGLGLSQVRFFKFFSKEPFTNITFDSYLGVSGGVRGVLTLPRSSQRIAIISELWWQRFKTQGAGELVDGNIRRRYDIDLKQQYLKLPLAMRYQWGTYGSRWYGLGGISLNMDRRTISVFREEEESPNGVRTTEVSKSLVEDFYPGLWVGLGWQRPILKRAHWFTEIRGEREFSKVVNSFPDNRLVAMNLQLVSGISF